MPPNPANPRLHQEWVSWLIETGDPHSKQIGRKCRAALAERGYELPAPQAAS